MFRTKSASAMSSTRTNSSSSNCLPIACTHSSCSGEVAVPQIAYFRTAPSLSGSAEKVALARHQEVAPTAVPTRVEAPDDCGRDAVRLAHDELGRARYLVGNGDLRGVQLVPCRIELAGEIDEGRDPGHPERYIRRPAAPGAAERVGDDDADRDARVLADRDAKPVGRGIRVERQKDERVGPSRVRSVDTRGGADEPVARLGDDERRSHAQHLARLPQDHLEAPRVGIAGKLACAFRGLDRLEL